MKDDAGQDAHQVVRRLAGKRVLVVGDLMVDEYLVGRATRLSREAPVPVLERTRSFMVLGGACNPAHNIRALGSLAVMAGVIGHDAAGTRLLSALRETGIDEAGIVVDPSRPTTTKTRLVAESALRVPQHLARIDHVDRRELAPGIEDQVLKQLEALFPGCDAVLVSHYRNGVVTQGVTDRIRQLARQHGALATVDAQADLATFAGFDLIKCNRAEAEVELGHVLGDDSDFERALVLLQPQLEVANLVITRGAEGMSALQQGHSAVHSAAARAGDVYDVVGAGDTVIAVLTLALVAGLSLATACHLANAAAGQVVRRLGNAVVQPQELARALERSYFA